MDVYRWESVAGSNVASPPDGAPEGWGPKDVNDWAREFMASVYRNFYLDGFFLDNLHSKAPYGQKTYVRTGNTTFEVLNTDARIGQTGVAGISTTRRIRVYQGASYYDCMVVSSTFTDPNTEVTVAFDDPSDVLPTSIDNVRVCKWERAGSLAFNPAGIGSALTLVQSDGSRASWKEQFPIGSIVVWPKSDAAADPNWFVCNGQVINRTTYATLFSLIGTTYGNGDGSTTFNLPNIKGRVVVGRDAFDSDFDSIGETGGSKTDVSTGPSSTDTREKGNQITPTTTHTHTFDIVQPYITLNWIIRIA